MVKNVPSAIENGDSATPTQNEVTEPNELNIIEIQHHQMDTRIGIPATLASGEQYPAIKVQSANAGIAKVSVIHETSGAIIHKVSGQQFQENEEILISFNGKIAHLGGYRMEVELSFGDNNQEYDRFYFTVMDKLKENSSKAAFLGDDKQMVYVPDYKGNKIPDFSGVGYMGGGVAIPDVPVKVTVEPVQGDAAATIQEAINQVSKLPLDENGFRGAVLLKKGIYEIGTYIEMKASGVVLRGEGYGDLKNLWLNPDQNLTLEQVKATLKEKDATILLATGKERRRVLRVRGAGAAVANPKLQSSIIDKYVPVGANTLHVHNPELFKVGDPIIVQRSGNAAWINEIKMDKIPPRSDGGKITQWAPFNLDFEHVISAIDGNKITIDSSLVNAIESRWGGGTIFKLEDPERISQVGIENLRAIAYWQPNKDGVDDTRHADEFVDLDNVKNAWVRNITLEHFNSVNGAIRTGKGSKWVTIQDSSTLIADKQYYSGKGYDASGRTFHETNIYVGRYGFYLNGQSALVLRNYALNNRHAFTLGSRVTGPNVYLDCIGENDLTWSEPHHRWSVGGLYDNVHAMISLMNRLNMGSGHGWAGANYVAWNTKGTLVAQQPPTAQNWAIGHIGPKDNGGHRGPDGYWDSHGKHVEPRSLYLQQLKDRLGEKALMNIGYKRE